MPNSFQPPGIESLADIETAGATYGEETIMIRGVVSPESQGGWPGENDGYSVHCFTFSAWRRLGLSVVKRKLIVLRPVDPDSNYWNDFPAHTMHQIRVLLSDDETRAIIEESFSIDEPDEELKVISAELQRPVIVTTERFGDLVLDRGMGVFQTDTQWNGENLHVSFPVDEEQIDDIALKTAETLWSGEAEWNMRIEEYVVEELLDLRNDTWRQDDEPELTATQFIARMSLTDISISSEGEFEFWYADGDLFWGHAIMVRGDLTNGPIDAGIHG